MSNIDFGKQPLKSFKNQAAFRTWLEKNHKTQDGIWLRIFKKASGKPTVSYKEAVDEALCFGWIDGQMKGYDDESYIQRFTPRRARSIWSKVNIGNVARLIKEKKMTAAGLEQVSAAKKDGRWDNAYHSSSTAEIPADFLRLLGKHKKAKKFYDTLSKSNRYYIYFHLTSAKKQETRERRMKTVLEKLSKGEKFTMGL